MSTPLTLTLKQRPARRLDLSALTANASLGLSPDSVRAVQLWLGRRRHRLDALFEVDGEDASTLVIRNACDRLDGIGAALVCGEIRVEGDAGHYLGRGMRGGRITLGGRCLGFAASRMRGGRIDIEGDAGDFLGAPRAGERTGMSGGVVTVGGSAGARACDRMRRGTVVVHGDAGDHAASRMIAGTLAVGGLAGPGAGTAMQRGTLVLGRTPGAMPATFHRSDTGESVFLPLMTRWLSSIDARFGALASTPPQRFVGDRAYGGAGEVLVYDAVS